MEGDDHRQYSGFVWVRSTFLANNDVKVSTGGTGRVPRGRPEIGDFRDHENLRFSNDLTPRVKPVTAPDLPQKQTFTNHYF